MVERKKKELGTNGKEMWTYAIISKKWLRALPTKVDITEHAYTLVKDMFVHCRMASKRPQQKT
jgi:hypothetical protein